MSGPEPFREGGIHRFVQDLVEWRQVWKDGLEPYLEADPVRVDQIDRCLRRLREFKDIDLGPTDLSFLDAT